jgi:hypothetical protein
LIDHLSFFLDILGTNISFTATAENVCISTGNVVSRKDNIKSKKVGEEHFVEMGVNEDGGYIRWNVYFTKGVSAPAREESVEAGVQTEVVVKMTVEAAAQTEPEAEISPRMSPEPKEKKKICSLFGFSCQKE